MNEPDVRARAADRIAVTPGTVSVRPGAPGGVTARLARYGATGGAAAVVDIGLFHALAPRFDGVLAPAAASFLVAAVFNYVLTTTFVFRQHWRSPRRAALFLVFATVGLAVNSLATLGFHHALGLPPTIAKTCGVGVAFLVNFAMNSAIVFRPVRTGRPAASPARMTASRRQRPS